MTDTNKALAERLSEDEQSFIRLARLVRAAHAVETGAGHNNVVNTLDGLFAIIDRLTASTAVPTSEQVEVGIKAATQSWSTNPSFDTAVKAALRAAFALNGGATE